MVLPKWRGHGEGVESLGGWQGSTCSQRLWICCAGCSGRVQLPRSPTASPTASPTPGCALHPPWGASFVLCGHTAEVREDRNAAWLPSVLMGSAYALCGFQAQASGGKKRAFQKQLSYLCCAQIPVKMCVWIITIPELIHVYTIDPGIYMHQGDGLDHSRVGSALHLLCWTSPITLWISVSSFVVWWIAGSNL